MSTVPILRTGGSGDADTQAASVVFALPGADGGLVLLSGVWPSLVSGVLLPAVRKAGEVEDMAKYKRYEWPLIAEAREKQGKPPRHGHVALRGVSPCGDCGMQQSWSQLAQYGGVCRWCWEALQVVVMGCEVVCDG